MCGLCHVVGCCVCVVCVMLSVLCVCVCGLCHVVGAVCMGVCVCVLCHVVGCVCVFYVMLSFVLCVCVCGLCHVVGSWLCVYGSCHVDGCYACGLCYVDGCCVCVVYVMLSVLCVGFVSESLYEMKGERVMIQSFLCSCNKTTFCYIIKQTSYERGSTDTILNEFRKQFIKHLSLTFDLMKRRKHWCL